MAPYEVKGRLALISGSARGFGKEFARRLLLKGAKVCLSDIDEKQGEETLSEFQARFGKDNVVFRRCDVTEESEWKDVWDYAESELGLKISILVNNAGINPNCGWKNCVNIMLNGTALGTKLALERMSTSTKDGQGGRIVNIASMAGIATTALGKNFDAFGYLMSKWGNVALTRSFNYEMEGIKTYAICPFFADTQLVKNFVDINELQKKLKVRTLTVTEVGHAFEQSLQLDSNGACYVVYPDSPVFNLPHVTDTWMKVMIAFGQIVANPLGWDNFDWRHVTAALVALFIVAYYIISCLLCSLF